VSTTADDLGVLGNLAEAIGLTNDGSFEAGWLSDPGEHLGAMLANERQRDALVAFIDEVLGGAERSTGPDGSTWLPIAQASAPAVTVFVVVDDRAADSVAIGLGVRVASTTPQASLAAHVPLFRAAKEGHSVASPILIGTASARATLAIDITTDAAPAVPGQARLGGVALSLVVPTGSGGAPPEFSLTLRGLQMPGAPAPRDLTLAISELADLESSVLDLVLGLARAQAAALPGGPLAALAGLVGLRDGAGVPPLPLQQLASDGVVALAHWLGQLLQQTAARDAWLAQLAALLGGAAAAGRVGFALGPLQLSISVPATPGAAGLVRIAPTIAIDCPAHAGVVLRGEATLCSLDLGNGSATALPSLQLALVVGQDAGGAALIDVAGPPALHVATVRAGFALDAARKPTLLLAADGVTIAGHDHATLDLSSPDAIAEVGATVFADVADEVLNRLGPAAAVLRVLLGVTPPAGVTPIALGALLQNPLAAVRTYWLGLVRDHADQLPALLTQVRDLLADRAASALDVTGDGSADVPWQIALAGPVVLQAWTIGDRFLFGPAIRFSVDDIGQRCTRIETRLALTLVDLDLAAPRASFLAAIDVALQLRARGQNAAVIDIGPMQLRADHVALVAAWRPASGVSLDFSAPNLVLDLGDGVPLAVPIPRLEASGRVVLPPADWAALEELLAALATAAAPPWLDDLIGLLGWRRRRVAPVGAVAARLHLAELVADPQAALRHWLADALRGDHELLGRALDAIATLVTGARNGVRGIVFGSGSPDDPWRLPLARGTASAELVAWVGPDGPLPSGRVVVDALQAWRPGSTGLASKTLEAILAAYARTAPDIAALIDGRDAIAAGFDALVARWSGSDGRILPPTAPPAGIEVHRFADRAQRDLVLAVDLEDLLGAAPATVVHVAVAAANALPWPDVPADRIVDLAAPGLLAAAFTPPAAATGDWFVALGGRDACRIAGGGDEDGIQGQADRIAQIVGAFAALGGGLAIVADAGAGHAARRAAEAVAAVTALVTLGTPLDAVSLQVLDAVPGADALRLLLRLLPPLPVDETDELGDDPDLHLGRRLIEALTEGIESDDPPRELRPPSSPPAAPRAGLAVHMMFGEVGAAAAQRAITAIVAAGLGDRAALRALAQVATPKARPDRLVVALAAQLAPPSAAAGTLRVDARAQLVLGELRVDDAGVHLNTARTLQMRLGVGRSGGAWLIGGPDPARAPGEAIAHDLRRISVDLALPLAGGNATATVTLHEARVFDLVRERWQLQASDAPTTLPGFDAATTLLPEARVLLAGFAQAIASETTGAGAALAALLRAVGAIDAAGGSVPDAIEHLLNDARAALAAVVAQATSRAQLVAALRALWPQGADAADGEVLVSAGPLTARIAFAPFRIDVTAGAAAGTGSGTGNDAFGWFAWQARLVVDATGVVDGSVRVGAAAGTGNATTPIAGAIGIVLDRSLRLSLAWSRPGAASADEIELWPNPEAAAFERAVARLVPAELTRQALEGLRGLDDSARPIIDAALSAVGLLGVADSAGNRRVLLPAALFADAAAWLRSEAALGLGAGFAPAKLVAVLDALRPILGVANANGVAGTWALATGVTLRADADGGGSARLGLAIDTSAFELPVGATSRLVAGGAFQLVLAPNAAARAGVDVFVGLPGASTGRSAIHVVFADQLSVFLRPATGADVALFPNPAGLGALAASAVTQALPFVLDALADLQPHAGVEGQVGTLVVRIGDALALRSAGHFQAAALQAWAADPAAALAARLPTLVATALDAIATAIGPLLPGGASAAFTAGELRITVGGFTLGVTPSPLAVRVAGDLAGLPAIDHAHLALALNASGLASFELGVGPATIDAGGVLLRPAFDVVAGNAPVGGARARLALGLPGNRLVGARWLIGNRFDLVLIDGGSESTALDQVALGLLEAVLDLVASFVLKTTAVTQLLAKPVGGSTVQNVAKGVALADAPGPPALIGQLFEASLLLPRLQRLATNVAAANPSITIDNALTIGLAGTPLGGGAQSIGIRVALPKPAKLIDTSDLTLSLETDARWIDASGGAPVPDGIVVDVLRAGPGAGVFAFTPGFSVNGVGLRVGKSEKPLLSAGSFSIGSVALHVFARVEAGSKAGGVQLQLAELAAGVAGAGGGNGVAQGVLGDAGKGPNGLAPAFSPALAVQKHDSGPILVQLRAGDGDGPWWLAIQKGFGPLYIEQVGFGAEHVNDQLHRISVLLDGRVSLFGLTAAVDDLQLSFVVDSSANVFDPSRWAVDLAGLAFNADMGGITLEGGLRKFGSGDTTQYVGMLMGRFAVYGLSVFGGYGQGVVNGEKFASFFAFGAVNGPIGGPPAFFLTGIGGGLGINRLLVLPSELSHFDQYPLIKALDPAAKPSGDPMAELIALGTTFPMARGSFWFAAGVSFTSFALVDGVCVISVQVGDGLEVALLGLARMALPRPQVAIVSIELGLVARFSSKEGVLWVQAQLTDNSWLLYPDVRLTGGFAFVSWFKGPLRGQFVLTIGGYHPKFKREGYPLVPRLGLNWRVGPFITIKGESYFALTSEAVMAGVRIEVSATFGPAWAQLILGADGIVFFDPFHFEVEVYASIRAGVTIDVWIGQITISISISAKVMVEGPKFHGIATFSVGPVDLEVEFGDSNQPPRPLLPWGDFVRKYLEEAGPDTARVLAALTGKGALPSGTGPGGATDTAVADGTSAKPFEVYAEFEITITNAVPTRRIELGAARVVEQTPSAAIGLAPMGLSNVATVLHIELTRDSDHSQHIDALQTEVHRAPSFPLGVWGPAQDAGNPKLPKGDVLEAIDGLKLASVADIPPGLPPIDYKRRVEAGVRHPLPFVSEKATRPAFLGATTALRDLVPGAGSDEAVLAIAAEWAGRGGASRTAVASLRGERAAPPRLGSLTDGLAVQTPPKPAIDLVTPGKPAAVHTFVQRPKVVALLGAGLDEPERAAQQTTVAQVPAGALVLVDPPTLDRVAAATQAAIPAVLNLVPATRGTTIGKTLVAADSAPLSRIARAPIAAVRGRGATREVRERLSALNGALARPVGARGAITPGSSIGAGEVVVLALPNAARDLDEQTPRPRLAIAGANARVVALRHGGETIVDVELGDQGGTFAVPLGSERIAVAVGIAVARQRPGFSGWHAGSMLPMLGHGSALAAQAVVHVEGRARSVRQRGLQRESGWLRASDLVEGTALVSTRFAAPVTLVIVALDDPALADAGRGLSLAIEGGARATGADGAPVAPTVVVRGQRALLLYPIVPAANGTGGVTVSVASEDGWHLVGVMAAAIGADIDAVAAQLASTSLDLVVRGAVAPGTAQAQLSWLPAAKRGHEIAEVVDTGTPRSVRRAAPVARAARKRASPTRRSRTNPE